MKTLTASAQFRTQGQSSSRIVRSSRKNSTRLNQAQTPPIRSKSPKKLCILAGEKAAERVAAARKATSARNIGSPRRSSRFRPKHNATTSIAVPVSTRTRKYRFRGTTYGKKNPLPKITGTSMVAASNTIIAVRHEVSGRKCLGIRTCLVQYRLCQPIESFGRDFVPAVEGNEMMRYLQLRELRLLYG